MNPDGTVVLDSTITKLLKEYRSNINYHNSGGVKVLMHLLRRDYNFFINHKKIYRLCKEHNLLLPRNKKKIKFNRKVSQK